MLVAVVANVNFTMICLIFISYSVNNYLPFSKTFKYSVSCNEIYRYITEKEVKKLPIKVIGKKILKNRKLHAVLLTPSFVKRKY